MIDITLISTRHQEEGNCNAENLNAILNELKPEVVFLEALEDTYTRYQQQLFLSFDILHKKLEIKAIQRYLESNEVVYVPVLKNGLPKEFYLKYDRVTANLNYRRVLDEYNEIVARQGIKFLNTHESTKWQEQLRTMENLILDDDSLSEIVNNQIEDYEDTMIKNIYSYCENNDFNKGVFLCGGAHRQSLIQKFQKLEKTQQTDLNWKIYGE